jgi:DnaK suppressor protein
LNKSTAKTKTLPKKAVKKIAVAVSKAAPRAAAKANTKGVVKPKGKVAAKSVPKPAAKTAAKAAPKNKPKVAAKPAPKSTAKAVPSAAVKPLIRSMPSAKPASTAVPAKPAKVPKPAKPLSAARSAAAAGREAAAAAAATAAAAAVAAAASAASASRFADRFAPPKPSARGVAEYSFDIHKPAVKPDPKLANAWKQKSGRELSEAELLAMPSTEYMNEKQLDFFRNRLTMLKDDLLSNAGETTEHLREDTSIVPDPADRATIEEEHALELRTRDRERKLLKKISQSLARIENGDYGFCDETGEPIGLGRLLARPTATLSLEAQQRREMKQKMFGD